MASNSTMIKKLQQALNLKGDMLLYSTSQFYSDKQQRPVTVYCLRRAYLDEETQKTKSLELFKTTSQIQMVLFLRDMWFGVNGWDVPDNNPTWDKIKEQNKEERDG